MSLPWCLAAALAWLGGVFWQTASAGLMSPGCHAAGAGLAAAGVVMTMALMQRSGRRYRPTRSVRRPHAAPARGAAERSWHRWLPTTLAAWNGHAILLCACLALLGWSVTGWRAAGRMAQSLPSSWAGQALLVEGQVDSLPQAVPAGAIFDLRVLRWLEVPGGADTVRDEAHWPTRVSLRMNLAPGEPAPAPGQRWRLRVRLHPPDGPANPGGWDPTLASFERGVRAVGSTVGSPMVGAERGRRLGEFRDHARDHPGLIDPMPERPWQGRVDRMRLQVRDAILAHVSDTRAAGILAGLSVGDQSAIDQADWLLFRQTGIAHLVSISGAHIAMFGWMAALLVRRLWSWWPRGMAWAPAPTVAMWSAVASSAAYAVLAGWGVPAQRTVCMMLLMACLRAKGRLWPWPLVWLLSACLLTAADPWAIRQVGFWLSYVAVGVLLSSSGLFADGGDDAHQSAGSVAAMQAGVATRTWRDRLAATLPALASHLRALWLTQWLMTVSLLPLSLVLFQQASLSSLLANLIAIPLFTVAITPLALLGALWPPCWQLAAWLIDTLMALLAALAKALPWMAQAPAQPGVAALAAIAVGALVALPMRWRWRLGLLPCVLPLLHLPASWQLLPPPRPGHVAIVAADVGQGTAVLIRTAHQAWLFDTGPRMGEQFNAGDRMLLPMLRAMGVTRLDALAISHQDTDHVGGAPALIGQIPIGRLISTLDDAHPLRHQPGVNGQPLPHELCLAGAHWDVDGVRIEALHPWRGDLADRANRSPNAISCVLKLTPSAAPTHSVLLTGDIEAPQEEALVSASAPRLRSMVLVAPHHGSDTSSTEAFLKAVQPAQVVVQAGRRNRYGHPSPAVLHRYEAMGLAWTATPDCGAYSWSSEENITNKDTAPAIGACWRQSHQAYWDRPAPMAALTSAGLSPSSKARRGRRHHADEP